MNKLNIIPGFKEGGVGTIVNELKRSVKEPITRGFCDKQAAEEVAKIAEKVPAETYRGIYMPMTNPYIQARHLSTEQLELLKNAKNEEEVESLLKSFKYYEKLSS